MKCYLCILVLVMFSFCVAAQGGVSYTWTGGGSNTNWDNAANWGGVAYPVAGDTAVFNVAGTNLTVTINGSQYADIVTLSGVGSSQALGNLTLAGTGTLTVTNSTPGTYLQIGMSGANNYQGLYGTATLHSDVSMARSASLGGLLTINPLTSNGVYIYGNAPVAINPGEPAGSTHGTAGTLTINGNVTFGSTLRQMNFDLSLTPGSSDLIAIGGTASLNYLSNFNIFNSDGNFGPGTYTLMTYAKAALFNGMFVPNVGLYNPTVTAPAGFTNYAYSLFDTGTTLQLLIGHKYTWAGAAGADWSVNGNWTSPTGLTHPQTNDSATFAAGSSVLVIAPQSLATMTLAGAWSMSGSASLTVTTIKGTGAITINGGTLVLNGQTVSGGPTMIVASGGTLSGNGGTSYNGTTLQSGGTIAGSLVLGAFTATGGTITPGGPGAIGAFTANSPSFDQVTFAYDLAVGNTTPAQGLSGLSNGYCNDYTCITGSSGTISFGTSYVRVNPLPGFASSPGTNAYQIVDYSLTTYNGSGTVAFTGTVPSIPGYLVGTVALDNTSKKIVATFTRTAGATFTWTGGGGGGGGANWWNAANWDLGFVAPIAGDIANISLSGSPTLDLTSLTAQTGASTFVTLAPTVGTANLTGSGTLTLNNGSLNVTSGMTIGSGQTISGTAAISIEAGATLGGAGAVNTAVTLAGATLSGTLTLGSNVTSTGGTFSPGGAGTVGTIVINGSLQTDANTVFNLDVTATSDLVQAQTISNNTLSGKINYNSGNMGAYFIAPVSGQWASTPTVADLTVNSVPSTYPAVGGFMSYTVYGSTYGVYVSASRNTSVATTFNWIQGPSGKWGQYSSWAPAGFSSSYLFGAPQPIDTVVYDLSINPVYSNLGIAGTAAVAVFTNSGTFTNNNSLTVNSAVTVGSGQTLAGSGTLIVPTLNINRGGVGAATLGGSLHVTGNVVSTGGTFAPGNSGAASTLSILGNLTADHATTFSFDLGAPGTSGGGVNDLIAITGSLSLDGTLNVSALSGFTTGTYQLFTYTGSLTGAGLSVGYTPDVNRYTIDTSTTGQVNLVIAVPYAPGDVNHDGNVNAADIDYIYDVINVRRAFNLVADVNNDGLVNQTDVTYELNHFMLTNYADGNLDKFTDFSDFQILLDHWQGAAGWATGDWTGDQLCDFSDFQKLLDYWNPTGWSFSQTQVPEPASLSLLALGALALLRRRKAVGR